MGPTGGGSGGGMGGGQIPGMGGGGKKKERAPVKDFSPKDLPVDKQSYFSKENTEDRKKNYKESPHKTRESIRDFSPKGLPQASPSSFHKGGKVKKSGKADVLKGEEVLTAKQSKEYRKIKRVAGAKAKSRFRKAGDRKSARTKIVSKKKI